MKKRWLLIFIVILAAVLRIGWLDKVPPSLSWDEVAIGYNAWSILKTGKDEYGTKFPLVFRSFDDSKQPVTVYLTVLSEAIFGLSEWGVRFPSAFFGTLTVILVYFLVKELFASLRQGSASLVVAFLLAINPWHVNFSRGAFETNLSLFFFVAGVLCLFKALKKPKLFLAATTFFGISMYTYYTTRVVIPLMLLVFALVYKQKLLSSKRWIIASLILGFLLIGPLLKGVLVGNEDLARVGYVSIFTSQKTLADAYSQEILRQGNLFWARVLYNRRLAYFVQFMDNYLKSLAPDFIFVNGLWANGLFYLWEIVTLPLGFLKIFKSQRKWKWVLLAWFFSVPIVGGLSIGAPNAFRNLPNVVVMAIFSGYGLISLFEWLAKKRWFKITRLALGGVIVFSLIRFCFLYFSYMPPRKAIDWGDGYKQLAVFLNEKNEYDRIWVSGDYWRPYIHLLFHLKYPPFLYQQEGSRDGFGLFRFGKDEWEGDEIGVKLDKADLEGLVEGRTMFVLSSKEYQKQKKRQKFSSEKLIGGRFAVEVFWAVEL